MDDIKILEKMIKESNRIVFFGGAGVSTESGIPDFRSSTGLYNHTPEELLSYNFFLNNPDKFYKFYRDNLINDEALPNFTHEFLTELQKQGKLKAIVTQNIDGLHQLSGSNDVYELHGSVHKYSCMNCNKEFSLNYVLDYNEIVPMCDDCDSIVRPSAIMFGEKLDEEVLKKARNEISNADMLIVGGTSLVVSPAAGLIRNYKGNKLVIINLNTTKSDKKADLVIKDKLSNVLKSIDL